MVEHGDSGPISATGLLPISPSLQVALASARVPRVVAVVGPGVLFISALVARSVLIGAVLLASCSKHSASTGTATSAAPVVSEEPELAPNPADEARRLFNTKCIVCHGDHGAGDGPGAAVLNPKPRAFADATWQASVSDEQIKKTIVEGGAAVGKSAAMSANPELADKPDELTALLKIVRDFKH